MPAFECPLTVAAAVVLLSVLCGPVRAAEHSERLEMLAAMLKEERGPGIGERFRDCAGCPELVVVPSGSYMMGSRSGEEGRFSDEGPVHRVRIAEPIAVGVYEVTFGEWDVCRGRRGCTNSPNDRGWWLGPRPVVNVSWHDAQAYGRWLSRETGEAYRILSESEWEYVARAGTERRFW